MQYERRTSPKAITPEQYAHNTRQLIWTEIGHMRHNQKTEKNEPLWMRRDLPIGTVWMATNTNEHVAISLPGQLADGTPGHVVHELLADGQLTTQALTAEGEARGERLLYNDAMQSIAVLEIMHRMLFELRDAPEAPPVQFPA